MRDYYTDASGAEKPGRRGITLAPDMLDTLIAALPPIQAKIQALGGAGALAELSAAELPGAASSTAAAASAAGGAGGAASGGAAAAQPAPSAAAAKAPPAAAKPATGVDSSASGGGGGAREVDLGGRKRAAVSTFTGQPCVDLRVMYEVNAVQAAQDSSICWPCMQVQCVCCMHHCVGSTGMRFCPPACRLCLCTRVHAALPQHCAEILPPLVTVAG